MNIECIIFITNALDSVRKTVDLSVYSEQAYFLAVCCILRLFFFYSLNYRIKFQNCPSNTEQFLHQLVYNNITNTRVAAGLDLVTFIDTLYSKSILLYLNTQRISFTYSTIQVCYFFTLKDKNCKHFSPATPRVVVGSLTYRSYHVLEQLELFLTILSLESIDSTFSLQSISNIHIDIARWKHVNISLQTVPGLLTVP